MSQLCANFYILVSRILGITYYHFHNVYYKRHSIKEKKHPRLVTSRFSTHPAYIQILQYIKPRNISTRGLFEECISEFFSTMT